MLSILTPLLALAAAQPATAPATQPDVETRTLTVSPAPADGPDAPDPFALTYALDERPVGTAATLMLSAFDWFKWPEEYDYEPARREQYAADRAAVEDAEVADLDVVAAERYTSDYGTWVEFLEQSAPYAESGLSFPWREQGFQTLLPHLNESRGTAKAMAIRAKLHAAQGEFEEALDDVRTIHATALHVGADDEPFLVSGLVGVGTSNLALDVLRQIIGQSGAPNLYWPLATMPLPYDFGRMLEIERESFYATFPDLRTPQAFDAADWAEMSLWFESTDDGSLPENLTDPERIERARAASEAADALLPRARDYLTNAGVEVGDMGQYEALARYTAATYDDAWRRLAKRAALPLPAAVAAMRAAEADLEREREFAPALSVLPTTSRALAAIGRLERERAALMAVEALRDHAAEYGELPASLGEMRLHVPADPMTGGPFGYEVDSETATLAAERIGDEADGGFVWTVRLLDPADLAAARSAGAAPRAEAEDAEPVDPMVKSASNLRMLGLALIEFASDAEDGRLPPGLDAVAETVGGAAALADLRANPRFGGRDAYRYVAAGRELRGLEATDVLMYEAPPADAGEDFAVNVLLGRAQVRVMPLTDLEESAARQGFEVGRQE